jgi:hypothetical protein
MTQRVKRAERRKRQAAEEAAFEHARVNFVPPRRNALDERLDMAIAVLDGKVSLQAFNAWRKANGLV